MARGHGYRNRRRIVCDIDEDVWAEIQLSPDIVGKSTSEKIRTLIEWGLMALDDKPTPQETDT